MVLKVLRSKFCFLIPLTSCLCLLMRSHAVWSLPKADAHLEKVGEARPVPWKATSQWVWTKSSDGAIVFRLKSVITVPSSVNQAKPLMSTVQTELQGGTLTVFSGAQKGRFELSENGRPVEYRLNVKNPIPALILENCSESGLKFKTTALPFFVAVKCVLTKGKVELNLTIPEEAVIDQSTLFETTGKGEPWRVYELSRASLGGEVATVTIRFNNKPYLVQLVWDEKNDRYSTPVPVSGACAKYAKFDDTPLKEAILLFKSGHYLEAHSKIDKSYDLHCKEVPPVVSLFDCEALAKLERWDQAAIVADQKIQEKASWYKTYISNPKKRNEMENVAQLEPADLNLVWCGADARSRLFSSGYEKLSEAGRASTKEEVMGLADLLTSVSYNPDRVERLISRVTNKEEQEKKLKWRVRYQLIAGYLSWEERPHFYTNARPYDGKAVALSSCLGAAAAYQNGFYSLEGGACLGVGNANVQLDGDRFDNAAAVQAISIFTKAIKKVSDAGSGYGLQLGVFNHGITSHTSDGSAATFGQLGVDVMVIGRLSFRHLFFDLKGGSLFGQPSAIWNIETGYSF